MLSYRNASKVSLVTWHRRWWHSNDRVSSGSLGHHRHAKVTDVVCCCRRTAGRVYNTLCEPSSLSTVSAQTTDNFTLHYKNQPTICSLLRTDTMDSYRYHFFWACVFVMSFFCYCLCFFLVSCARLNCQTSHAFLFFYSLETYCVAN